MVIENVPANSILLTTFNALEGRYGKAPERPKRLRELFGPLVPDDLSKASCKDESMQATLSDFAMGYINAIAADTSRPGGFRPAFRVLYKDTTPMVTVGGIFPTSETVNLVDELIASAVWPCRPNRPIRAPHLTMREALALRSQLPRAERLTRQLVRELGFDLEDEQIEAFEAYYRQYPAFAEIVT